MSPDSVGFRAKRCVNSISYLQNERPGLHPKFSTQSLLGDAQKHLCGRKWGGDLREERPVGFSGCGQEYEISYGAQGSPTPNTRSALTEEY